MKQKYKLSKKAEAYLKAQGGLQVPYEYPYQDNTSPFDLGQIDPNLLSAQQNQTLQSPVSPNLAPLNQPKSNNNTLNALGQVSSAVPFLGTALKLGTGIYSLIQAGKEKKKAKRMKSNAERDLQRRMTESRENDFFYTGQSSGMSSDYNAKGGVVYQNGGFMDFYNQQQGQNKDVQQYWNEYYQNYLQEQNQKVQGLQQQGLSNTLEGGLGLATSLVGMQDGGLFKGFVSSSPMRQSTTQTTLSNLSPEHLNVLQPDIVTNETIDREREAYIWNYKKNNQAMFDMLMGKDPEKTSLPKVRRFDKSRYMKQDGGDVETETNEDLYSSEFQSPIQQDTQFYFQETMNKYQALDPQGSLENKAMSWIFEEEEEPRRYDIGDVFQSEDKPILKVVEDFKMMGLNPSSVDSGKHNVGSRHYQGRAVDLGLNTTFGGDINKMKQFKQWFETEGKNKYPGLKLIDETERPAGQKEWSGAHYHLEY